MSSIWFGMKVELLGGRGEELWPYPGRIFAVGPTHTFEELAAAINTAFARWDRSPLSVFMLADGTRIADPRLDREPTDAAGGTVNQPLEMSTTNVADIIEPDDTFQFVFDLGDRWVHQCTVQSVKIDPLEKFGIRPTSPLVYHGWGNLPDQHGRSWDTDDGEILAPSRPNERHPMLSNEWPAKKPTAPLNMAEVRGAIHRHDLASFTAAITGRHLDDALQQIALGAPLLLENLSDGNKELLVALTNRLSWRGYPGDRELANDLHARLHDDPLPGRTVAVDLEMFVDLWEGDPTQLSGGYLDLHTGEAFPTDVTDPVAMGDDTIDVENDPDRYLWFDRGGGREGWQDMASFATRQTDDQLRARLEQSIRGRGAFRAFRDIVYDTGLGEQWNIFSTERQLGRARAFLADEGIRAI